MNLSRVSFGSTLAITGRLFRSVLISFVALLLFALPVLAAYSAAVSVANSSATAYTMLPLYFSSNNYFMSTNGFMEADSLDTRVLRSSVAQPHMVANNRTLTAIPVPASSNTNLQYTTGNTDLVTLDIVFGYNGYMTVADAAALELGSNWQIEYKACVDTSAAMIGNNIMNKSGAIRSYVSAAGTVKTDMYHTHTAEVYYSNTSDAGMTGTDVVYATARTQAAADSVATGAAAWIGQNVGFSIYRSGLYFDTSALPDDAVITAATLSIYGSTDSSVTDFDITVTNGQPTHPADPMVVGDYDRTFYTGSGGTLTTAGFSTVAYNVINLNATGISWINLTGTTKLMLLSSRDIGANEPAGQEMVQIHTADAGGTANDPMLTLTYTFIPISASAAASSAEHTIITAYNGNLLTNGSFERGGLGNPPTGWNPTGLTIDVIDNPKVGTYSMTFTGPANFPAEQDISVAKGIAYWRGKTVTYGVWGLSQNTNSPTGITIRMRDGVGTSPEVAIPNTTTWYWKTTTITVDMAATGLWVENYVRTLNNIGYVDGANVVEGTLDIGDGLAPFNFGISVDGGTQVGVNNYEAEAVIDNSNSWVWGSAATPYFDYISQTVGDTLVTHYHPTSIIGGIAYSTGTVTVTNGDATVTGAGGAAWTTECIGGSFISTDGVDYTIASLTSSTVIELSSVYGGATLGAQAYNMYVRMPDLTGAAQNGRITWGTNPAGVTAALGAFVSTDQPAFAEADTPTPDIAGDTDTSNWFLPVNTTTLTTNPFYPIVRAVSVTGGLTTFTEAQIWQSFGITFVLLVMCAAALVSRGHMFIVGVGQLGATGAVVALTIFPLWVVVVSVVFLMATLAMERTPSY